MLHVSGEETGAWLSDRPVDHEDSGGDIVAAAILDPSPSAKIRGVGAHGDNAMGGFAKGYQECTAELSLVVQGGLMGIVSRNRAERIASAKPVVKRCLPRHFGPIKLSFATQEKVGLKLLEPLSQLVDLGVIDDVCIEAVNIPVGETKVVGVLWAGPGVAEVNLGWVAEPEMGSAARASGGAWGDCD